MIILYLMYLVYQFLRSPLVYDFLLWYIKAVSVIYFAFFMYDFAREALFFDANMASAFVFPIWFFPFLDLFFREMPNILWLYVNEDIIFTPPPQVDVSLFKEFRVTLDQAQKLNDIHRCPDLHLDLLYVETRPKFPYSRTCDILICLGLIVGGSVTLFLLR